MILYCNSGRSVNESKHLVMISYGFYTVNIFKIYYNNRERFF